NNGEAQEAIQVLTEETFYRLEAGYFFEEFDFASETHGQSVELLYTGYSRTSLLGRFGFQHKFDENNGHFSLGLTRRLRERTYVRGEVGFAPRGQVLANQDYEVELTQSLHPAFALGVGYRFLNFRAANVHVVTSLMNWDVRPNLHLAVRYVPARTHFDFPTQKVWNHSGWARLAWDINRTWSPYISFGVGSENFSGLSAEQLGRFAAQTYGGGLTVHVRPRQGFRVGYFFQNRTEGRSEQQAALAFFLRF
ncbi:MAG: YaiO family outer membrane beta-barrel protein, partial [Acidobacteria bacterium]|nr:YaiO family outer membrane beta-barrel protein [Acidobacteriota bacterium]